MQNSILILKMQLYFSYISCAWVNLQKASAHEPHPKPVMKLYEVDIIIEQRRVLYEKCIGIQKLHRVCRV